MKLTIKEAKENGKAAYDYHCIITGRHKTGIIRDGSRLDGCHLYDCGLPAYSKLKNEPDNIIPLITHIHTSRDNTFDYIQFYSRKRKPHEKIEWIVKHVLPEYRQQLIEQIERLEILRKELNCD